MLGWFGFVQYGLVRVGSDWVNAASRPISHFLAFRGEGARVRVSMPLQISLLSNATHLAERDLSAAKSPNAPLGDHHGWKRPLGDTAGSNETGRARRGVPHATKGR